MLALLLLLLLASSAFGADVEITSLPFTSTGAGNRYYLAGDLTWSSGVGITISHANSEVDGQGFKITGSGGAVGNGISLVAGATGTQTVHDITVIRDPTPASTAGVGLIGATGIVYTAHHVKVFQFGTGANDYALRLQGAGCLVEQGLFVRSTAGVTVANVGNVANTSISCCTFVGTGTSVCLTYSIASGSSAAEIFNNIFVSGTPTNGLVQSTGSATWTGLTAFNNCWYRTNTGPVLRYNDGATSYANYVNSGSPNITGIDPLATVGNPNLVNADLTATGDYSIDETSTEVLDNGGVGFLQSTDLAGNDRTSGSAVDRGGYEYQYPTGSCCAADGTCTVTIEADCVDTWTLSAVCDPNPCPQPGGGRPSTGVGTGAGRPPGLGRTTTIGG